MAVGSTVSIAGCDVKPAVDCGTLRIHPWPGTELPKNGGILLSGYDDPCLVASSSPVRGAELVWNIEAEKPRLISADGETVPLLVRSKVEDHVGQGNRERWVQVLLVPESELRPGTQYIFRLEHHSSRSLFRSQDSFPGEVDLMVWSVTDEVRPLPQAEPVVTVR